MTILYTTQLSYQLSNGDNLFSDINLNLNARCTALVGRNGSGKSILAAILAGKRAPSHGTVSCHASLTYFAQLPSAEVADNTLSIAQFLGVATVLDALDAVAAGSCQQHHFDMIGERWNLREELNNLLLSLGLGSDLALRCGDLSGGQLARMQLWVLFQSGAELLILDEPSNHLDIPAKHWLLKKLRAFNGHVLLVSHDRLLLNEVDEIWELNNLGITRYGGNYDYYHQQKLMADKNLDRKLDEIKKARHKLEIEAQLNREKAQKRVVQGKQKSDGQAKILVDFKKNKASARTANLVRSERSRMELLDTQQQVLSQRQERVKRQKLYITPAAEQNKSLLQLRCCILPYGNSSAINLQIHSRDKLHLHGANGGGKSTLLKLLMGQYKPASGEFQLNTSLCYLDQDFSLLTDSLTLLDSLALHCPALKQTEHRTLLAGIGFRRDAVYRQIALLSGGEKMKLAMLMVCHQRDQPLLLLDEPDNHLDLPSKQLLAETLNTYQGAFVLVSHDQDFVTQSGINRIFSLD